MQDDNNEAPIMETVEHLPQSWTAQEEAVYQGAILSTLRTPSGLPVTEGLGDDNDRVTVGNVSMRVGAAIKQGLIERDPNTGRLLEIDPAEIAERRDAEAEAKAKAAQAARDFSEPLSSADDRFLSAMSETIQSTGRDPWEIATAWVTNPESTASKAAISMIAASTGEPVEVIEQHVQRTVGIVVDRCVREADKMGIEDYAAFTDWLYKRHPQHQISSLYLHALGGFAAPLREALRRYVTEHPEATQRARGNGEPVEVHQTANGREYVMHGRMAVSPGVARRLGLI